MNMNICDKLILFFVIICNVVDTYDLTKQKTFKLSSKRTAHISPEIINEFKDFKNLIPAATIDEIVAEHYFVDGNFRTALKYLRSDDFTLLQKQLLNVPEIIDILEFLHLTAANATMRNMGATKIPKAKAKALIDEYSRDAVTEFKNRVVKMTNNTDIIVTNSNTMTTENANEVLATNKKVYKTQQQQFHIKEHNNVNEDDDDVVANEKSIKGLSNEQQPLVRIVLLDDFEVKKVHQHRNHKDHSQRNNNYNEQDSIKTFTTFVEQVLQHLPHNDYQNMIRDKCKKNTKFAEFYQALRSPALKPLIEQTKKTANILKIIETLNSHDVDVNSLEPIAFKVISWGPVI